MSLPERIVRENWFTPVSYEQFKKLSVVFMDKAKKRFKTEELDVSVTLYKSYRMPLNMNLCSTKDSFKVIYRINKELDAVNTLRKTNDISEITKEEFDKATSVCVSVHPKRKRISEINEYGLATFKDKDPNLITMYLQ